MDAEAAALIAALGLRPHPEGGHYVETWRDAAGGPRGHSTAIYFLLARGESSHWHRVTDAAEIWHHYRGAPLELELWDGKVRSRIVLGPDIEAGERPQAVAPAGCWQAARSLGAYTLVGCTVAPGFDFAAFEFAPPDWRPPA